MKTLTMKSSGWFQRLVSAVAWLIYIAGKLIMVASFTVVALWVGVNLWNGRGEIIGALPWVIGAIAALIAIAVIWEWAREYVERH